MKFIITLTFVISLLQHSMAASLNSNSVVSAATKTSPSATCAAPPPSKYSHFPDQSKGGWEPVARDQNVLFAGLTPEKLALMVKDIPVPQSPLAEVVRTYAQQQLPEKTFNHSNRIFFWGMAIARAAFPHWKIDEETYYVTCLLHDIGLADAFHLTTKMSFEFKGGIVARDLLLLNGASEEQADSVAEAIIRHQDVFVSGNIHQNGQLIQISTLYDNTGRFDEWMNEGTKADVCRAFPRNGWSGTFACTIEGEMRTKPWSHTTSFEVANWRQVGDGSNFGNAARNNTALAAYD